MNWQTNTTCAASCTNRTQSDEKACVDILNCYQTKNCGPATCSGNTQPCGANTLQKGTAGYQYAKQVYDCLMCPPTL